MSGTKRFSSLGAARLNAPSQDALPVHSLAACSHLSISRYWGTDANRSWNLQGQMQEDYNRAHQIYVSVFQDFGLYKVSPRLTLVCLMDQGRFLQGK